jgi:hypothetical protein
MKRFAAEPQRALRKAWEDLKTWEEDETADFADFWRPHFLDL